MRAGSRASTAEGLSGTIAVLESSDSARRQAVSAVQRLGYRLAEPSDAEAILAAAAGPMPPELILLSLPESQELLDTLRELPTSPVVIASLAGPSASARDRLAAFDAELYTVRPHSEETLGPVLHAAMCVAESEHEMRTLRSEQERLRDRLLEAGHSGQITGFQHFEYFKRLLVLEIKRAKRYDYDIAVCLIAQDAFAEPLPSEDTQRRLKAKVAAAITSSIRDIDIPVDYAGDRMLLFLPFTDADGAKEVGERVLKVVRSSVHTKERGAEVLTTVSVGIAAMGKGKELSFARMMREATSALEAAFDAGGDRVVVRV